jgi:hypothetical protein
MKVICYFKNTSTNKVLLKMGAEQLGYDSTLVQISALVTLLNICTKNPHLRQYVAL